MNVDREEVSVALFNLVKEAYPWNKSERATKIFSNVPLANMPYCSLLHSHELPLENTFGLTKWSMNYLLFILVRADSLINSATYPDTTINEILNAIELALRPHAGERQTLGGLVYHAWISGGVEINAAIIDQQIVILVPITVRTGS